MEMMENRVLMRTNTITYLCPHCLHRCKIKYNMRIEFDDSFYVSEDCGGLDPCYTFEYLHTDCPNCGTEMIEIDPGIIGAISMLWVNNIKTVFCCEGHVDSYVQNPYDNNELYVAPHIDFLDNIKTRHEIHTLTKIDRYSGIVHAYRWKNDGNVRMIRVYVPAAKGPIDKTDAITVHQVETNLESARWKLDGFISDLCVRMH